MVIHSPRAILPFLHLFLRRFMPPALRKAPSLEQEQQAIVRSIIDTLVALKLPPVLPRLDFGNSKYEHPFWAASGAKDPLIEAVRAAIHGIREGTSKQRYRKDSDSAVIQAMNELAAGNVDFDSVIAFRRIAVSLGMEDKEVPRMRLLRRQQSDYPVGFLEDDASPPSDETGGKRLCTEEPEPAETRGAVQAAAEAAAQEANVTQLAATLNALSSAQMLALGSRVSPERAAAFTAGHAGSRTSVEHLTMALAPEQRVAAVLSSLEDPDTVAALNMQVSPSTLAALTAGHAASQGSLKPMADLLPTELRRQLAPPPPVPPPPPKQRSISVQTDPVPPEEAAEAALDAMEPPSLLPVLDSVGKRLLGDDRRHTQALRRCAIACQRIDAYRDPEGRKQANFLLSILETYGADDGERLPLFTVLTWLLYYSHRIGDDLHYGKNISGLKFNLDGGMYEEFWRDFKFIAGNAAATLLRGPFFSNMIKSGRAERGKFFLNIFPLAELRERLALGGAIPSVRALNGQPKPADRIDRGGMSEPLGRALDEAAKSWRRGIEKLMGTEELQELSSEEQTKKLSDFAESSFDHESMRSALLGADDEVELVFKRAKNEPRAWWEDEPVAPAVGQELLVEELVVVAEAMVMA